MSKSTSSVSVGGGHGCPSVFHLMFTSRLYLVFRAAETMTASIHRGAPCVTAPRQGCLPSPTRAMGSYSGPNSQQCHRPPPSGLGFDSRRPLFVLRRGPAGQRRPPPTMVKNLPSFCQWWSLLQCALSRRGFGSARWQLRRWRRKTKKKRRRRRRLMIQHQSYLDRDAEPSFERKMRH